MPAGPKGSNPSVFHLASGLPPAVDIRLGLGGGLFYRFANRYRIQFDYAYKNYGVLGSANAFTVTLGVD